MKGSRVRADARDNRARIMTAADEIFGRSPNASTDDVARQAGVGIATVFRHFPTKTELLEAVLTLRLERLRDRALELAGSDDPGAAFYSFFTQVVSESASKLAIAQALIAAGSAAGEDAQKAGRGMREAFDILLTEAQRSGAVRTDAAFPEVYALLVGASRGATAVDLEPATRDKMLALVYDGLKP
ncbi:TetR/AcrR family transcriptional regulator [Kribbella sp. NPDC051952]|uniref:TetR/AcrR family transcriptional regulator n=1 Tax=Kribbella sp. NPDC051952 TaxID=3154851 RepID=UPI00344392EF